MGVEIWPPNAQTMGTRVHYLLIVARNEPDLYEYLTRNFSGVDKVQVILDRRQGERRRVERRQSGIGERDLRSLGVAIIRRESEAPSNVPSALPPRSAKILVIDDDPGIREILVEVLADQGHAAVACADGQSGLARFREEPFDLVVTDLKMPGFSGWEVVRAVKLWSPETPVVLVTGSAAEIDVEEARVRGVDFLIGKPFKFDEVERTVARALSASPVRPGSQ